MASRPNMSKINSDLRKLKSAASDLQRYGRQLQQASDNLDRAARRARSMPRSANTRPLSFSPAPSEAALLHAARLQVAADPVQREHDVFLSHASPDLATAQELHAALVEFGAEVWLDDFSIKLGRNIVREIDLGIASSRVGVVLVTPAVVAGRYWVEQEFSALLNSKDQVIPVLHNVEWGDLQKYSPLLGLKKGLSTADRTIIEIAEMIVSTLAE